MVDRVSEGFTVRISREMRLNVDPVSEGSWHRLPLNRDYFEVQVDSVLMGL